MRIHFKKFFYGLSFLAILFGFGYLSVSAGNMPSGSAQSGVSLLESILEKMHNMPQVASGGLGVGQVSTKDEFARSRLIANNMNANGSISPSIIQYKEPRAELQHAFVPPTSPPGPAAACKFLPQIPVKQNTQASQVPAIAGQAGGALMEERVPSAIIDEAVPAHQGYLAKKAAPMSSNQMLSYNSAPTASLPAARFQFQPNIYAYDKGFSVEQKSLAGKRSDSDSVAMLPPPIIAGISFVRLGDSEHDLSKTISKQNNWHVNKESIRGWSVWSLMKEKSVNCAAQIFVRHGVVNAIRVFDSSLLQSDIAVKLEDKLSAVKEKFGEPAFIISEKTAATSQNYIYPLSQIAFQLTRTEKNKAPQIASMLIFSVK